MTDILHKMYQSDWIIENIFGIKKEKPDDMTMPIEDKIFKLENNTNCNSLLKDLEEVVHLYLPEPGDSWFELLRDFQKHRVYSL